MRNRKEDIKVDFVMPWVDGGDPEWRKQKDYYNRLEPFFPLEATGDFRFRDWDNLKYWFRGVEQFASWVNKIHFITWGHLPKWLNTDHPKLHIVKHEDIIPQEYLPIFNSRVIETSIGNIDGLSEHFVYFNDDTFIIAPISQEKFFRNGLPCCEAHIVNHMQYYNYMHFWMCMLLQNMTAIKRNFNSGEVMRKHWRKFINTRYSFQTNKDNIISFSWRRRCFPGFSIRHIPNPFLKSVFWEVNQKERDIIINTYKHRFRSYDDVNQYLYFWWQICKGNFYPQRDEDLCLMQDVINPQIISQNIRLQEKPLMCISDNSCFDDNIFEETKRIINDAFESILPEKCSFEK